jgi:hypothetical protein
VNTYAATDVYEYLAEGEQDWFNMNAERSIGNPDGVHNYVNTREELRNYDNRLFIIFTRVLNPLNLPLHGMFLRISSRYVRNNHDGRSIVRVRD